MLKITRTLAIPLSECEFSAIRAQGAGGQNVNKVSSAIHLRFDVRASSLPQPIKDRLLALNDRRINSDGAIVIKAQEYRSQDKNREDALQRLLRMIRSVAVLPKPRKTTRPSRQSRIDRLESKARRGKIKALRGRIED